MDLKLLKNLNPKKVEPEPTIEDVICREGWETLQEFEARKILTLKLASIQDYKINNMSAVVIASMMMKKAKLGLEYDENIERSITYLMDLLKR
jgi:hypothetical protein